MSQILFVQIVSCLCHFSNPNFSTAFKHECVEKYVNCGVIGSGDFLSVKDFDKKCNFQPKQAERCYNND